MIHSVAQKGYSICWCAVGGFRDQSDGITPASYKNFSPAPTGEVPINPSSPIGGCLVQRTPDTGSSHTGFRPGVPLGCPNSIRCRLCPKPRFGGSSSIATRLMQFADSYWCEARQNVCAPKVLNRTLWTLNRTTWIVRERLKLNARNRSAWFWIDPGKLWTLSRCRARGGWSREALRPSAGSHVDFSQKHPYWGFTLVASRWRAWERPPGLNCRPKQSCKTAQVLRMGSPLALLRSAARARARGPSWTPAAPIANDICKGCVERRLRPHWTQVAW